MSWIFESTSASKIGIAAPPESPKTYSTPSRSRHCTSLSPPVGTFSPKTIPPEGASPQEPACSLARADPEKKGSTGRKQGPHGIVAENSPSRIGKTGFADQGLQKTDTRQAKILIPPGEDS